MSQAWSRLVKRLGLLLGAGILLQGVSCRLFELPGTQELADFAVGFAREALAAYLL